MISPVDDEVFRRAVALAEAGDAAGFVALVDAYQPRLVRYLTGRGVRDVEDIAQEVWVDVGRNLGRFTGGEPQFRSWLFMVARHRCLDAWRASTRRPETCAAEPVDSAGSDLVEVIAEERSELARVIRLVRTLPADQADVVLLRVVAGLEVGEVARLTRRSPGAVRVLSHRGLRRLAGVWERTAEGSNAAGPSVGDRE